VILWLVGAARLVIAMQVTGAAIVGTVTDGESREPVPGAAVTLPDLNRAVVSDTRGRYALYGVMPGPQHVTVRRLGFAPRTLHALVPRSGELTIDITLHPEAVRLGAVDVRPSVAIRGVDGVEHASVTERGISAAAVRNHPLLSEPDAFLAMSGGDVVLSPESPSGVHVRGGASDQTAFLLDGIPVLSPYHAAGTFSAWNPDALDRLTVSSPSPALADADALSGTVAATTRTPGQRLGARGSFSTTQARVTVDGPLGVSTAGYLLSVRSGFPGFIAPEREPSYLGGHTMDALLELEAPVFGGRVRLLGAESGNDLDASATARDSVAPRADQTRNAFEWQGRTLGAEWSRRMGALALELRAWSASSDAEAVWNVDGADALQMMAARRDEGFYAAIERRGRATTMAGLRIRQSRTSYRVEPAANERGAYTLDARTPMAALFGVHERSLGSRLTAKLELSAATVAGRVYGSPRAELRWAALPSLIVSSGYSHAQQFGQSLRNPEAVVGGAFPVDLYIGAGAPGIPVARSDDGVIAAEYRPIEGMRLGAQLYARELHGLVLVAPRTGEPFATGEFATGAGPVRGFALDAAVSGARYGLVASYGWQRTRLQYGDSSFLPAHATSHLLETGVILFPSATSSVRLGATGAVGRRATPLSGPFEWEACNLLDRGCELGGSPRAVTDSLGGASLPPYWRLDLGVRRHWHLRIANRDAMLAVFGTITNVLGRTNVLTYATDPATGEPAPIGMRPLAPLVVGIDWQF